MKQSRKTRLIIRAVTGLVITASAVRRVGYGLVARSQELDRWAEQWLIRHVRRDTEERFAQTATELERAVARRESERAPS